MSQIHCTGRWNFEVCCNVPRKDVLQRRSVPLSAVISLHKKQRKKREEIWEKCREMGRLFKPEKNTWSHRKATENVMLLMFGIIKAYTVYLSPDFRHRILCLTNQSGKEQYCFTSETHWDLLLISSCSIQRVLDVKNSNRVGAECQYVVLAPQWRRGGHLLPKLPVYRSEGSPCAARQCPCHCRAAGWRRRSWRCAGSRGRSRWNFRWCRLS